MTSIALVKTVRNRSLVLNAYSLCNLSIAIIASMRAGNEIGCGNRASEYVRLTSWFQLFSLVEVIYTKQAEFVRIM